MEQNEFSKATLQQAAEGISIDYKRVLFRAWSYWYIILLSLIVSITIAFLRNRYATRIYPINASLLVKEADDISGAEILYNSPLLNVKRNYLNEIYIIKSFPLIQRVVVDLNFDVRFYGEGNILTTEIYDNLPFSVVPVRNEISRPVSFVFKLLNDREFQLSTDTKTQKFVFGDTTRFEGFTGIIKIDKNIQRSPIVEGDLIFNYTPAERIAESYVGGLGVSWAEEGAGVINLSITGSNVHKELDFVNGLIHEYQAFDLEKKNETASRTVNFIAGQLKDISDSLVRVEKNLELFKGKNSGADLSGESLRLFERVETFETQKMELIIKKNYFDYLISHIEKNQNLDQIILPSSMGVNDPLLNNLLTKLVDIQLEIKLNSRPENPLVMDAKKRIEQLKSDVLASVKNIRSSDNIKLSFLEKQITSIENELSKLPSAQRTLISIQRNYALLENLYIYLLQKQSEAAISKAANTSDIVLVNPPRAGGAISPKTRSNYAIAIFAGFAIPLLFFVLFEFLDTRVQSKEDVERITTIPFIGGVGHKKSDTNLAVLQHPKSVIAESFRALRSNLNYFVGQNNKPVILITSSISGEGKTFTSLNLAAVYALSGKKTVIIGADLRKPRLFSDFNLNNDRGLSNYLAGLNSFDEIRQATQFENLDLISGGPVPPNPSELLLSNKMTEFIAEARNYYDCIIIDTPPMAIVTDAFVLAPHADHVLFLVRQNYTPKNLLRTVEDYYASGKINNISIVLNDIYRSGPGYGFGYGYAYGYGYNYGYGYGAYGNKRKDKNGGYYED